MYENPLKIVESEVLGSEVKDRPLPVLRQRRIVQVTFGELFVSGYRILRRDLSQCCVVLFRSNVHNMEFMYLRLVGTMTDSLGPNFLQNIEESVGITNKNRREGLHRYSIAICFVSSLAMVRVIDGEKLMTVWRDGQPVGNWVEISKALNSEDFQLSEMERLVDRDNDLEVDYADYHKKLKTVIFRYIDTFGRKHKDNLYSHVQNYGNSIFRLEYLLRTINLMVSQEMGFLTSGRPTSYTQMESMSWTRYVGRVRQRLPRKDLAFVGGGRICIVDVVFNQNWAEYIENQDFRERVASILEEAKKGYSQGVYKVMNIKNTFESGPEAGFYYSYTMRQISKFQ